MQQDNQIHIVEKEEGHQDISNEYKRNIGEQPRQHNITQHNTKRREKMSMRKNGMNVCEEFGNNLDNTTQYNITQPNNGT